MITRFSVLLSFLPGVAISLGVVFPAHAQVVTLDEFLDGIRAEHPFFAKEELTAEIQREGQNRLRGTEDWMIEVNPVYFHDEPDGLIFQNSERVDGLQVDASVGRAIWSTGGRVSLSTHYQFLDQDVASIVVPDGMGGTSSFALSPETFHENNVTISYSHPFFRNRGGILDRLEYEVAGFGVGVSAIRAEENQEDFLVSLAHRYLDWVLLTEERKIALARLELARRQLEETQQKREANLVKEVDVLRTQDDARIAQQNVMLIESRRNGLRAELAVVAEKPAYNAAEPSFDLSRREKLPSLRTASSRLINRSRIIRALEVRKQQLGRLLKGLENTKLPEVNLNLQAGIGADGKNYDDSLEPDRPMAAVGVMFRYPLGNRTARADVSRTELESRQVSEEIRSVSRELESRLRNLMVQLRDLQKVLVINQQQIESSRHRTREEFELYSQGQSELTFVIQSQDNEQNAKVTYARNATNYHKLLIHYRDLLDELFKAS